MSSSRPLVHPRRDRKRAFTRWLADRRVVLLVEPMDPRDQPSVTGFEVPFSPADGVSATIQSDLISTLPPEIQIAVPTSVSTYLHGAESIRRELVLIEFDTPDREVFLKELQAISGGGPGFEVVELHGGGVAEITSILQGYRGLDALHIVSHAEAGSLELGADQLDLDYLRSHRGEIGGWAAAFKADSDLLLYGCNAAAGETGQAFVRALSDLTGTDVTASVDVTG